MEKLNILMLFSWCYFYTYTLGEKKKKLHYEYNIGENTPGNSAHKMFIFHK